MIRSTRSLVVTLTSVLVLLCPAGAAAQSTVPADHTLDQVRSQFQRNGYDVGQALHFDWMSPPVTSFQVRDGRGRADSDRVLMVLLYPDSAAARSAHLQAQMRDDTEQNRSLTYSDEHGPRLVPGYGESVWLQNVALVQSSQSALNLLFAAALERDSEEMVGYTDLETRCLRCRRSLSRRSRQ